MSGLARLTEIKPNGSTEIVFINPDHVLTVREVAGGTHITLSDGTTFNVKEKINLTVTAIQGAQT